ncbi:unnamed protein product [Urochloa humidicola]
MASQGKKGAEKGGSRKKPSSSPRDAAAGTQLPHPSPVPAPRDAAAGTQLPHPSPVPAPWAPQAAGASTQPTQYASWRPDFGGGIHGGQSISANQWGSYLNLLQQSHFPIGENSHLVGVARSMNPPSPAPTPPGRVTIDIDDGVEANKGVKKRFWSHDEEVRPASAWLNTSKDPIHGNDKKMD